MSRESGVLVRTGCLLAAMAGCVTSLPAVAQTTIADDDKAVLEINDPTTRLRWFQLSDWYNASLHDQTGTINEAVFRTVLPFTIDGNQYAARFTQQNTVSASSGKTGMQDPELIVLRMFNQGWGRWGAGLVIDAPTGAEAVTTHKWSLGPGVAIATSSDNPVQYGANLRTWFSVGGPSYAKNVGIINLQPVFNIRLGDGQALSLGQSQLEWNTITDSWKSLQLGLKYDKALNFGDRKWAPYAEADYDFESAKGNPMWSLRAGITMWEKH
jgi:hypothetical protein